jgi:hypothetical protein
MLNCFKHAIDVRQHFVVPETDHAISFRFEKSGSLRVRGHLLHVLPAINLDDELCLVTCEIDNVTTDTDLPPEVRIRQSQTMPQMPPQLPLRFRRRLAHGARESFIRWGNGPIAPRQMRGSSAGR